MYELTLDGLLNLGRSDFAKENGEYLAVWVSVNGSAPEMIINPKENFEAKLSYYATAYHDDLTLKANPTIKIVRFDVFESMNEFYFKEVVE